MQRSKLKVTLALSSMLFGGTAIASTVTPPEPDWHIVPDQQLNQYRGGVDLGPLVASFAIQRTITVDGVVVARMEIVISNLDNLGNGGVPTVSVSGPVAALVQIMSKSGVAAAASAAQSLGTNGPPGVTSNTSPALDSSQTGSGLVTNGQNTPGTIAPAGNGGSILNGGEKAGSSAQFGNALNTAISTANGALSGTAGSSGSPSVASTSPAVTSASPVASVSPAATNTSPVVVSVSPASTSVSPTVASTSPAVANTSSAATSVSPAAASASPAASASSATVQPAANSSTVSAASNAAPASGAGSSVVTANIPTSNSTATSVVPPGTPIVVLPTATSAASSNSGLTTSKTVALGNTGQVAVVSNLPNASAMTTAVQNEVHGAVIQAQTTISATLNSMSSLNGLSLASQISKQVAGATGGM